VGRYGTARDLRDAAGRSSVAAGDPSTIATLPHCDLPPAAKVDRHALPSGGSARRCGDGRLGAVRAVTWR